MTMSAAASTTIPAMITNTSNCGRATTATRPVEFTMALHGIEQSGDQHAGAGAVVEPASDQSAAQMREQEDAQHQRRGRP
jgi:hypothetical protein